ncbi:hypothetical protein CPC08DRAFT_635571 [Agrocybe pediades]|nr:hypothetical protein CPC08DRAFT_635571 [Agrocybe pediades]
MSRGDRVAATGILSTSMRDNYGEHGVEEYYRKVGSTYRNPHYPGIRLSLVSWLNKWWQMEHEAITKLSADQLMLFDMACEATLAFVEWCRAGKKLYQEKLSQAQSSPQSEEPSKPSRAAVPPRKKALTPLALGPEFPKPQVVAADPFTAAAFNERTGFPCAELSFEAIAEGSMPDQAINIADSSLKAIAAQEPEDREETVQGDHLCQVEMVVCSFAMHLIDNPSSLFSLLWELSSKARWLIILAPHKKPEIKSGWGWNKWDIDTWKSCEMTTSTGELLYDRVHCRVYRSVNF